MKTNVDLDKYRIYNDIEEKLHAAILKEKIELIENIIRKFNGVENVPDQHFVTGIYLENSAENEYNYVNSNEAEIKIKNLRFDNL